MHPTKTETIFPPKGFTAVTGVEEYVREQRPELNKGGIPVKNASYWKRKCDKLQAEVERLRPLDQPLEKNAHIIKSVATRCAEIARNSCLSPPDGGSPTPEEVAQAEYAAQLIEKEYGL